MGERGPQGPAKKNGNITTPQGEEFWDDGKLEARVLNDGTVENYVAGKLETKTFSTDFIKERVRILLRSLDAISQIKTLSINGSGNQISIETSIVAEKFFVSVGVDVRAILVSANGHINVKSHEIHASKLKDRVEGIIVPKLSQVSEILKSYIEKEGQNKVGKMEIENGELKVTFIAPKIKKDAEPRETPISRDTESDQFKNKKSKTLENDPRAKLDHYHEIYEYLNKLDPKYIETIVELASQRPPMEKKCKVSICIPVAGHQEAKNIYESLKNYTYQTVKKENFEIVLFVNHPEKDQNGNPLSATATLDEIERFKKDYPELKVRVMYEALPNNEAKIGKIRKLLADATLVAQHERGLNAPDLIMVSNDADNKGIDPRYVQTLIDKFEDNPQMDGCLGQLDWDPESYQEFPVIHVGTRLFQYLNSIGRHRSGGMVSSGANSAFRSSIYAGIGGYMDDLEGGEDVAIGRAIIAARDNDKKSFGFAGAGTRLFTSSRRAINALYSGLAPVEQWDDGFSAFDDEIRKINVRTDGTIDYENPEVAEKLKELLEHVINRTLDLYESGEKLGKDSHYYRKALGWMGVEYKLDAKGDVVITNMVPVIEDLKRYQITGKLIRDARSGKPGAKDKLNQTRKNEIFNLPEKKRSEVPLSNQRTTMNMDSIPTDTLLKDSEARLDPMMEIEKYFERMAPHHLERLKLLNEKIGIPMNPETKIVACIPVAGHQEASNIYKTLASYAQQKGDLKELEILLFVNSPEEALAGKSKDIQKTITEIERAKKEFPLLQVRSVQAFLPEDEVRIGNIRKIGTDLALLRQQLARIKRDLILLSNDADNQGISERYVDAYIKYFKEHPEKEGAVGNLQFDPDAFIRFPLIHLQQELATFLDQVGFQNGNVTLFGGNSAMKSSIYAAVGGYPPGLKTGEQYWTGETIRKLRKKDSSLGFVKEGLLTTSSRRGIISLILQKKEQVAFGDHATEAQMRDLNLDSFPIFDFANKKALEDLKIKLEQSINETIIAYEKGEKLGKDAYYYRVTLEKIGILYEVDSNGIIHIKNMDKFIKRQKIMQEMIRKGEKNMAKVIEAAEI